MNYPKVVFKPINLEDNIDIIKWTFFERESNLNMYENTISCFPKLKNIDLNNSEEEINKLIEEIVSESYILNISKIENDVKRYNELWNKINDKYFEKLYNYFDINLGIDEIEAYVGIIPIFPRYLSSLSFSVGTDLDEEVIKRITAHEVLHFAWFNKWKKLYPETPKEHFESPYIEWEYSEMVTDSILNNEPFKEFKFNEKSYDFFYELDGGKLMDKLNQIYSSNETIEKKIEDGFNYIKKSDIIKK